MPVDPTLRDPPIPLPHDPATAGSKPAPEIEIRKLQALRKLLWLVAYVALMRLLGYRMPRPSAPTKSNPAAKPAPTPPASAAPQPTPRQTHRTLDRAYCLDLLASISAAFAAPRPAPVTLVPAPPAPGSARRTQRPPPRRTIPAAPIRPGCAHTRLAPQIRAPVHPPPRQNAASPPA